MQRFGLKSYPKVVDPAASVLEVQYKVSEDADTRPDMEKGAWRQFHRLSPIKMTEMLPFDLPEANNFFGPDEDPEKCLIILAYNTLGVLRYLVTKDQEMDWMWEDFPEEFSGDAVNLPSLRLIFADESKLNAFCLTLNALNISVLRDGAASADLLKNVVELLLTMPMAPRRILVRQLEDESKEA
jgi:hypothetical protein